MKIKLIILILSFSTTLLATKANRVLFYKTLQSREGVEYNAKWHTDEQIEYGPYGVSVYIAQDFLEYRGLPHTLKDARRELPKCHLWIANWLYEKLYIKHNGDVFSMAWEWHAGWTMSPLKRGYAVLFLNSYNDLLR